MQTLRKSSGLVLVASLSRLILAVAIGLLVLVRKTIEPLRFIKPRLNLTIVAALYIQNTDRSSVLDP